MRLAALVCLLVGFTVWSLVIVAPEGLPGLFALLSDKPWGQQVFVDLAISLSVAWAWLVDEAKARGISAWPYLVATPFVGSIAVLTFLVHREVKLRGLAR
jgi:predicted small integral membrane protein